VIGGTPIHYSRAKRELDARITALNGGKPIPHWTWHDLRRTFRSGLGRCGVLPHIAELCIAHAQPALRQIYDQNRYENEKCCAFNTWAAHVMRIVAPPEGKVVPLLRQVT
jgi:hypothetical protein